MSERTRKGRRDADETRDERDAKLSAKDCDDE